LGGKCRKPVALFGCAILAAGMVLIYLSCDFAPARISQPVENATVKQDSELQYKSPGVPAVAQSEVWEPCNLRYDNLQGENDEYPYNQIAVWHTECKCRRIIIVSRTVTLGNLFCENLNSKAAGNPDFVTQDSPLIILPSVVGYGLRGMFVIETDYSGDHFLSLVASTSYFGNDDDETLLSQPGWGLQTTFSPDRFPYKIQGINVCAVAYYTVEPQGDYDKYHVIIRILDKNGSPVWKKVLPWSVFRGSETVNVVPKAEWKYISVDNITVNSDFSVEVLSESDEYQSRGAGRPDAAYFALAYEKISDPQSNTPSFISYNGQKAKDYIMLYGPKHDPLGFNLCLRVAGSCPAK